MCSLIFPASLRGGSYVQSTERQKNRVSKKESTELRASALANSRGQGPAPSIWSSGAGASRAPSLWDMLYTSGPRNQGQDAGFTTQPSFPGRTIPPSNFSAELISRANLENRTQCIRGKRNESPFIHGEQHVPKIQISCKNRLIKSLAF